MTETIVRRGIAVGILAWSVPVCLVAAGGLGLAPVAGVVVGVVVAAFVAVFAARALQTRIAGSVTRRLGSTSHEVRTVWRWSWCLSRSSILRRSGVLSWGRFMAPSARSG